MADLAVRLSDGRAVSPSLVSGPIVAYAPAYAAKDSRIFAPCGSSVFCYSAKTTHQIGILGLHRGQVTAVCPSAPQPKQPKRIEPLATGTTLGELRLWDPKTCTCLASLDFGGEPILALRWPSEDTLLVLLGRAGEAARVERVQVEAPTAPRRAGSVPLSAAEAGAFDACGESVALVDGKDLRVWKQGWRSSRKYPHKDALTSLSVDPQQRYVAVGDIKGVVWTWWGVLETDDNSHRVPARWHWHANPVRALAHCGPLMISGGDEAVLCIRNVDDHSLSFIPRFPGAIKHLATSASGQCVCASLEQNSLAVMADLQGWVAPRYITALDVPMSATSSQTRSPVTLHPMAHGGFAMIGSGRRVQFLDDTGHVVLPHTISFERGSGTRSAGIDPMQRWVLQQIAVGAKASCLMTCESRRSPALERFDKEGAHSYVLKWWRLGADGQYVLDSVSHDPHSAEVTVLLAHPQREHFFVTGSLDGAFKSWDLLPLGNGDGAYGSSSQCWQCVTLGGWHTRPILCGCLGADGSALALGFSGFVVLWETETAVELQTLSLGEETDEVSQLFSTMACGHFLLFASVRGSNKREEIMCWDLVTLQLVTHIDLASALGGVGRSLVRLATPAHSSANLSILACRPPASEIRLWQLSADSPGGALKMSSTGTAVMPAGYSVIDSVFHGSDERLLCVTSGFELWDLDLSQGSGEEQGVSLQLQDEDSRSMERGKLGRLLGSKANGSATKPTTGDPLHFFTLPLRTTAAQQAGLVPRLVERVIPAHIPSHQLPPPSVIWTRFLSVFGMPAPDATGLELSGTAAATSAEKERTRGAPDGDDVAANDDGYLPPWLAGIDPSTSSCKSELVDVSWADQLVQDALVRSK